MRIKNGFENARVSVDVSVRTGSPSASAPAELGTGRMSSLFSSSSFDASRYTNASTLLGSSCPPSSSVDCPSSSSSVGDCKPSSSSRQKVFILGNQRRPRTLASLIRHAQRAGMPIDASKFSPEALRQVVPRGTSLVVTPDGQVLGTKATADVKANADLGVAGHLERQGVGDNAHTVSRRGPETLGQGGTVDVNGSQYDVENTFLKSPVALDLNGDGRISTTGVSTAQQRADGKVGRTVQFDVDGDGVKENTEWMAGGDGLLVDDRDGGATRALQTGQDINGKRLFGDQGGAYANGYDKLARLDTNGDGRLTGKELTGLKVWVDDGDAKLESGELKSLADLGVTELSTGMHRETNARGESLMRSSFVRNGQRQMTEDVWFATRHITG